MLRRPPRTSLFLFFFFNDTATTEIYTLSLHDALPICMLGGDVPAFVANQKDMNFELVAVSDIWKHAREQGAARVEKVSGSKVDVLRNNDELYARKDIDAV